MSRPSLPAGPSVTVRDLVLGAGRPALIVPLTAAEPTALHAAVAALAAQPVDLVEWRIDRFRPELPIDRLGAAVAEELASLRAALDGAGLAAAPLLLTFRTGAEGGARTITDEAYRDLLLALLPAPEVELVDVEAFRAAPVVRALVDAAHEAGTPVVGSNHDMDATPPREEIARRLRAMHEGGMDIAKIAVMPRSPADVLDLLAASVAVAPEGPVIAISMGRLGAVSRVAGEVFGSAATFGTVGEGSAPGQPAAAELARAMDLLAP